MDARTVGLSLLSGLAMFLVVGVAVTELASARIEFSLFVGIPVGLAAGLAVAAFVYVRLGEPVPERRRPALALAGFGVGFVVALVAAVALLRLRNSLAIPLAGVVGVVAAAAAYARAGGGRRSGRS